MKKTFDRKREMSLTPLAFQVRRRNGNIVRNDSQIP